MGKTAVDTGVMDQQAAQIDAILRMLNRAAGRMKDSRKALEWNEAASARLRQSVRSACEDTAALSERMEALKKVLAQIAEEYRRTEQALTGKEGRGAGGSAGTGQAGGGNKKSVDLDEFFKEIGKIFYKLQLEYIDKKILSDLFNGNNPENNVTIYLPR